MLVMLALSLALIVGLVRAAGPTLAGSQNAVAQVQAQQGQVAQAQGPGGTTDTDNVQQGDQTGPDTPGVAEDNTTGPDTDNVQQGDQSGPDTPGTEDNAGGPDTDNVQQ